MADDIDESFFFELVSQVGMIAEAYEYLEHRLHEYMIMELVFKVDDIAEQLMLQFSEQELFCIKFYRNKQLEDAHDFTSFE